MSSLVETNEYQACLRLLDAKIELKQTQARARELRNIINALQPPLLAYFTAAGLESLAIKGYLLAPHREPWIRPMYGISRQRVCEALKIAGLGRMVKEDYSTTSLTKYVKDLEDHAKLIVEDDSGGKLGQLLHPALAEILSLKAAYSIHITKKESPFSKYNEPETETEDEGDEIDEP